MHAEVYLPGVACVCMGGLRMYVQQPLGMIACVKANVCLYMAVAYACARRQNGGGALSQCIGDAAGGGGLAERGHATRAPSAGTCRDAGQGGLVRACVAVAPRISSTLGARRGGPTLLRYVSTCRFSSSLPHIISTQRMDIGGE